ncbi:hypothetical protein U3C44_22925 (plasmid) [Enterobacter asburiae]|uniref:hypothetical protein n=1 Tax=Enterobacter asburiae TaxID=61645 RepID=UPI0029323AFF|nr:hypothetical protein [Enterobacter asburiae]EMA4739785.1 hypothetical protein [Enterobacter asburiae]
MKPIVKGAFLCVVAGIISISLLFIFIKKNDLIHIVNIEGCERVGDRLERTSICSHEINGVTPSENVSYAQREVNSTLNEKCKPVRSWLNRIIKWVRKQEKNLQSSQKD